MTVKEIMDQLKAMATDSTRHTLMNHGGPASMFGVKVGDLKTIQKKIKKDHELSLELYDTGNADAQYLAGLIADEKKITRANLEHWVKTASWHMQSEYTVPWIAAESNYGWDLAVEWIDSKKESIQSSGWATLASLVALEKNSDPDLKLLSKLIKRVEKDIGTAGNRVRYVMNSFLISVGIYVEPLRAEATKAAKAIGPVSVDMGGTSCKVPFAPDYINKALARPVRKKKMARC